MGFIPVFHDLDSSNQSLSTSFKLLDDSNNGIKIGLERNIFCEDFNFFGNSEILNQILDDLISLRFLGSEVAWNGNFQRFRGKLQFS